MQLIEIFKAGKRTDAQGVEITITPTELQQAVAAYDPAFHESPVVIGHPKDNHPAYAWVKRLQLDGDVLKAELDQIDPDFAEMVEKGRYKKVSASFYLANSPSNPKQGSLYLRHVGFLGAMPPAVKGLKNPVFNEQEEGVVEFEEPRLIDLSTNQQGEKMDKDQQIQALQAQLDAANAAKAEAEAAKAKAQSEANQLKADKAAFCEKLIADGKLAPVAKEGAITLLNAIATQTAGYQVEFNEGENLHSIALNFLNAQPQVLEFGELANKQNAPPPQDDSVSYAEGTDPQAIEVDKQVRAHMKQHNVDYTTAFNAIFN